MNKNVLPFIALVAYAALVATSHAQIVYNTTNSPVSQNFDAPVGVSGSGSFTWTDDSTLPGWFSENAAAGINSQYPGGISTTQVLYSFRNNTTDVGAGSDRGFGTRTTSGGTFSYALGITNNTGITLTGADINFVSALWRTPSNSTSDSLNVGYAITTAGSWTGLSYTAVSGLSTSYTQGATGGGVNADPNASGLFYAKSTTLTGLSWANGDTLYLSFVDGNGAAAWGIDNFSFTAVPEPSVFALLAGMLALAGVVYRRRMR